MTLADILPSLRSSLPPRLDERHWPSSMHRRGYAELQVGGVRLSRLAADYGTPLQVLDEADVRQGCAEYVSAFGPAGAFYSAKAGMTMVSGRWIAQSGLGCYVVSAEQLAAALAAGFPPEKLVLAGPAKSVAALEAAFACGAAVVAGSVGEAAALGCRAPAGQRVLVRVLASGQRCPRAADGRLHVEIDGVLPQCPGDAVCGAVGHATELVGRAPGTDSEPAVLTSDGVGSRAGGVAVRVPADVTGGDLLVLAGTGAYHTAGRPVVGRPAVVSVADGLPRVLQRRVNVTDLLEQSR
ncbi:MAG TPA: hypothetical protein VN408_01430 [Actinoplanes sp.]|nr:hypothetical protein [Actinoplanes sp.]